MKSAVLVVGGGISGMRAAAELLVQGFKVYLLEEGSCIDRQTAVLDKLFPPGECAACALQPLVFELTSNPNSTIFTSSKLLSLHGEPGDFKVEASVDQTRSEDGSRNVELSVGAVIVGVGPETENGDTLERLGLKLGDKGGARRDSRGDHPCYTSRDGVFVCGTTGEPKEIEKSVIQACAAAANVAALLAPAKDSDLVAASGSMHLPIEAKDEPRIFVVVDQGAFHGSDVIDLEEVCEYTRTLTGVKSVEVIPCSCDGSRIVELLSTGDFNCLVVAGPSPITHEYLFQRYAESAGLNRYLVEIVNLHRHCAAVHSGDRKAATNKAKSLMRMGVARVQLLKPIEELRVSITQRCLVVGGSAAGLACAAKLAEMGLQVDLVEMTSDLSDVPGNDHPAIVPLVDKCLAEDRVSIHTQTRMTSVEGRMGAFTVSLAGGGQAQTVQVGAIVMATVLEVQDGDDGAGLEEALAIRKGEDGFYVSTEGVLNVLDFDTAGVFNCGPARAMLGAVDALIEGEAAASRAACIIASGVMSRPPTISSVVDENCDGCAYCVDPCPTRSISSVFQVEPRQMPTGKHAEPTPPPKSPPRAPFGPSVTLIDGTPRRWMPVLCHISAPAAMAIFSSSVICPKSDSIFSSMVSLSL